MQEPQTRPLLQEISALLSIQYRVTALSANTLQFRLSSTRRQFRGVFIEKKILPTRSANTYSKAIKLFLLNTLSVAKSICTNKALSDLLQAAKVTLVGIRGICSHGKVTYEAKNDRIPF